MTIRKTFVAPALPVPPIEYDPRQQTDFMNALRLYFNLLDNYLNLTNSLLNGATETPAPTIASAATIAPTYTISFVSGTTTIQTITPPVPIANTGGQITLIPTGLWSTNTAGNIALGTTAVVSKALIMTYDSVAGKWYPSY